MCDVVHGSPNPGVVAGFVRKSVGQVCPDQLRQLVEEYCKVAGVDGVGLSSDFGGDGRKCIDYRVNFSCGRDAFVVASNDAGFTNKVDGVFNGSLGSGFPVCSGSSEVGDTGSSGTRSEREDSGCVNLRGPNWVRNKKNRDDQKRRKLRRQQLGQDWRKGQSKSPVEVTHLKKGFFSDCAEDTQKQLKESRAKYLIAENERKAQEEIDKLAKLNSPEKTLFQAIKMIEVAEKQAKKANDSKIAGWAETVATSYAESIARSAPSSVPSFEAFSEKLAASSTSDLSLALEEKTKKNVELEQRIHELQDRMANVAVSQNSRIRQLCAKEVESEKKIELEKKKYDAVVKRVRELEEKECGVAHRLIPGTFRTRGVFEQFS